MATLLKQVNFSGGSNSSHFYIQLYYDLKQETTTNKSTITYYLYVCSRDGYSGSGSSMAGYINENQVGTFTSIGVNSKNLVGTKKETVTHDNNGNKSVNYSASVPAKWTDLGSASLNGTLTLPKINRYPILTKGTDFTDEGNPSLEFSSYGLFNIRVKIGTIANPNLITRDLTDKNAKSYNFELTNEEREMLRELTPNSNELVIREVVAAMNDAFTTQLNASYKDYKMTIINANPTFNNFKFEDINEKTVELTGDDKSIISGYSDVKVTIPVNDIAVAQKMAIMSKYRVTIGENNSQDIEYSNNTEVNAMLSKVTSGVINTYAIDSRGNSTMVTKQANNIIRYTPIAKGTITATRGDGGIGEIVTIKYNGTFDNVDFGSILNSIKKVTYTLQKTDSDEVIKGVGNIMPSIDGDSFSFEGVIAGDNEDLGFDIESSYVITLTVYDELSSTTFIATLPNGKPNIALHKNGVGIMGKYDESIGGLLQVDSLPLMDIVQGTNSKALKFYDGTLICFGRKDFSNAVTGGWGNVYSANAVTFDNYPVPFIELPALTVTGTSKSLNYWIMTRDSSPPNVNYPGGYQIVRATGGTVSGTFNYIAIGRWK